MEIVGPSEVIIYLFLAHGTRAQSQLEVCPVFLKGDNDKAWH